MSQEQIDEFSKSALDLVKAAEDVPNPSFRKVLYLVMIDALSSIRYRRRLRPSERFVKFVRQYAQWPEGERISLPQAQLYLRACGSKAELLAAVSRRLDAWGYGQIHDLNNDPLPSELPLSKDILRGCQHFWLLWALRNSLIHGFRHPAFAHDGLSANQDAPFYHGEVGSSEWRLVYPAAFHRRLLLRCIEGAVEWLREQKNDPFPASDSGLWVQLPAKQKRASWQWLLLPSALIAGLIVTKACSR